MSKSEIKKKRNRIKSSLLFTTLTALAFLYITLLEVTTAYLRWVDDFGSVSEYRREHDSDSSIKNKIADIWIES